RRKSRTAFTAQQVLELERRFVVTWFQNRRAKLKRDVEEMRADLASLRSLSPEIQCRLALPDAAPGLCPGPARPDSGPQLSDEEIQVDD
ncbi:hypothetical protein E2I00_009009, partial [Balaenoptera physalus]